MPSTGGLSIRGAWRRLMRAGGGSEGATHRSASSVSSVCSLNRRSRSATTACGKRTPRTPLGTQDLSVLGLLATPVYCDADDC
eukprot:1185611-Prorocentrum_minimum.AAC.1